ncbi:MAG: D-tyrosyl-tRNA(Tyr) deacylase [Armatimonadetes bacterium]|nr:D-tyrosyl-tRNA(Tyr) deacylase [Armatimonadota bacterium]
MRAVLQRVQWAKVRVDDEVVGQCGPGFLLLVAAHREDDEARVRKLADRVAKIRLFNDAEGKMNLALSELPDSGQPQVLAVSNFTVYGDAMSGRRPSFTESAPYDEGKRLFDLFVAELSGLGVRTETGVFGAMMEVESVNDGPVTLVIDT